jgi:hypothetical protein
MIMEADKSFSGLTASCRSWDAGREDQFKFKSFRTTEAESVTLSLWPKA